MNILILPLQITRVTNKRVPDKEGFTVYLKTSISAYLQWQQVFSNSFNQLSCLKYSLVTFSILIFGVTTTQISGPEDDLRDESGSWLDQN